MRKQYDTNSYKRETRWKGVRAVISHGWLHNWGQKNGLAYGVIGLYGPDTLLPYYKQLKVKTNRTLYANNGKYKNKSWNKIN